MVVTGPLEQLENVRRHAERIQALQQEAEKRFWELYWDENLHWYGVRDQWGRIMFHPRPEAEIRGFFASLEPQA